MTIKRQKVAVLKTLEILEVYIVNKRGDELLMVINATVRSETYRDKSL
jgi:hypothetical protein